jgi:hypothetical protein
MPLTLTPWTESLVIAAIATLAFFLGRWFSLLRKVTHPDPIPTLAMRNARSKT